MKATLHSVSLLICVLVFCAGCDRAKPKPKKADIDPTSLIKTIPLPAGAKTETYGKDHVVFSWGRRVEVNGKTIRFEGSFAADISEARFTGADGKVLTEVRDYKKLGLFTEYLTTQLMNCLPEGYLVNSTNRPGVPLGNMPVATRMIEHPGGYISITACYALKDNTSTTSVVIVQIFGSNAEYMTGILDHPVTYQPVTKFSKP